MQPMLPINKPCLQSNHRLAPDPVQPVAYNPMSLNVEKELEAQNPQQTHEHGHGRLAYAAKLVNLFFCCFILALGNTAAPLLLRLYFQHGGKRIWLTSWLQTAGWPVGILPLFLSYVHRKSTNPNAKLFTINRFLFGASGVLGLLTGVDDYLYSYGASFLPASTSTLIVSTQLVFTAVFAIVLVKQRFTAYSINSVFLLTLAAVVLGVHSKGDRPLGVSHGQYVIGFIFILGAAALYGFVLPLMELAYVKAKQEITVNVVLESQMVISIFATALCTVGMLVNKDFQAITREAGEYELGKAKYYMILIGSGVAWQFFFIGLVGVVALSSSLQGGVLITALMPVTEILAVVFLKEKFSVDKGISLALSLWGLSSYYYGEFKKGRGREQSMGTTMP